MITDHPYSFCLAWIVICVGFGIWVGMSFQANRVKRLLARIELLKLECSLLRPTANRNNLAQMIGRGRR